MIQEMWTNLEYTMQLGILGKQCQALWQYSFELGLFDLFILALYCVNGLVIPLPLSAWDRAQTIQGHHVNTPNTTGKHTTQLRKTI